MSNNPLIDNGPIEGTESLSPEDSFDLKVEAIPQAAPAPYVRPKLKVKPVIPLSHDEQKVAEATEAASGVFTPEQIIAFSKLMEAQTVKKIKEAKFDSSKAGQVLSKEAAPIINFSELTQEDIFNLDIPIAAKPFMDADILKVDLRDKNYEARWVNKHPQRLGGCIAKGFTYVEEEDLINNLSHEVAKDSEGHYSYHDVVCMKIDKATYFQALRHAYMRAINTTKQTNAAKKGMDVAAGTFREAGLSSDYEAARREGKMEFYTPGIEV